MTLTEENLVEYLENEFNQIQDWGKVYTHFVEKVEKQINEEKYSSLEYNYLPIFLYTVIKNKVDLPIYSALIKDIVSHQTKERLSHTFSRFFNGYYDEDMFEYFKVGKYQDENIWENLTYLFVNVKGKKTIIDKDNISYLMEILKQMPKEKVGAVYEGRMLTLFYRFAHDMKQLKPFLDVIPLNPALSIDNGMIHGDLIGEILGALIEGSYYSTFEQDEKKYLFMKKNYAHFDELLKQRLIQPKDSKTEPFKVNSGLMNWLVNANQDVLSIFDEKHQEIYLEYKKKNPKKDNENYPHDFQLSELIWIFTMPMSAMRKEKNFKFDVSKIDLSKNLIENAIWLKALEIQLKKGEMLELPQELIEYLFEEIKKAEDDEKIYQAGVDQRTQLEINVLMPYLKYCELNQKLENNHQVKPRNKI